MKNLNNYILEKLRVGSNLKKNYPTDVEEIFDKVIIVCNNIFRKFFINSYDMTYYDKNDEETNKDEDVWYCFVRATGPIEERFAIFDYLKDELEDVFDVERHITFERTYKQSDCSAYKIFLFNPDK